MSLHAHASPAPWPRPAPEPPRPGLTILRGYRGQPAAWAGEPTLFSLDPYINIDHMAEAVRDGYLLAYRGHTLDSYRTDLALWFRWCNDRGVPVLEARRHDIETFDHLMESAGLRPSTRQRRLISICGYYRYAEQEDVIPKSPGRYVRRPRVPNESTSAYLDRYELSKFLDTADLVGRQHAALCCLLALNGLRVGEAVDADVEGLAMANGHRTLTIVRKGGKEADIPLSPRTFRTLLHAIDGRDNGPLLLDTLGQRMTRHSAARAVRIVGKKAGIGKKLGPHALRHTFVSLGLDAGVPLRDMQVAAGHADVSTTVRYDRRERNLDKHAAYIVAAYAGGG